MTIALLQCGGGCSADPAAAGLALGAACGPDTVCVPGLLCVDGRCVTRPWPPDAASLADTVTPIDLDPVPADAAADTVAVAGADADTDADADANSEADADADSDADADGDAGADVAVVPTTRIMVGDHTAGETPSDDAVTLQVDQAAVAELMSPATGRLAALQVIAVEPPGGPTCGVFRVVLWEPDDQGTWPLEPTWTGPSLALLGRDIPQSVLLPDGPPVKIGAFRVGLLSVAACSTTPRQPRVLLDDSGLVAGTFVWARVGASATFIPGATLGLSGRWALRAGLDVPSR